MVFILNYFDEHPLCLFVFFQKHLHALYMYDALI